MVELLALKQPLAGPPVGVRVTPAACRT